MVSKQEHAQAAVDKEFGNSTTLLGCVRTSIGRMVPPPNNTDLVDIRVEPYATLPVERDAYCRHSRRPQPESSC